MPIYYITTREQAARGGEFSRTCLFDSDRLVAILSYRLSGDKPSLEAQDDAYVTSQGHEIADFVGLVKAPKYHQKNEEGWNIIDCELLRVSLCAQPVASSV